MAAYVEALKRMRKQLDQQANSPAEPPSSVGASSGVVQRVQQQSRVATQEQSQIQYSPATFAQNAMKQVRLTRGDVLAKMQAMGSQNTAEPIRTKDPTGSLGDKLNQLTEDVIGKVKGKGLLDRPEEPDGPKGQETYNLPQKSGNSEVMGDSGFLDKVKAIAAKNNIPVSQLLSVMHFETGGSFGPGTKNAAGSGATGLIQITPATAKALGTNTQALASMSRDEQLDYVDKYLDQSGIKNIKNPSGSDVYMSVFYPQAMGKDDNYKIFSAGSRGYEQNKGLDRTGKGYITKGDAAQLAMQYTNAYEGV